MKQIKIFLWILIIPIVVKSQNLVPNGSFELGNPSVPPGNPLPGNFATSFQTSNWGDIQSGTWNSPYLFSEIYNSGYSTMGVPENGYGTQIPYGGLSNNQSYVGLQVGGFINPRNDGISVQLLKPLQEAVYYKLKFFTVIKMGGTLDINIRLGHSNNYSQADDFKMKKKLILGGGSNNDQWEYHEITFQLNHDACGANWLFLRLEDELLTKIVFIDDVSLEDACHSAWACSAEYEPKSNLKCNEVHNSTEPLTIYHTDHAIAGFLEIREKGTFCVGKDIVKNISVNAPDAEFYWDGTNNNGEFSPDGNYHYKFTTAYRCACQQVIEGCFTKGGNYTSMPVTYANFHSQSEPFGIGNLNDVHQLNLTIFNTDGAAVIRNLSLSYPRNEIGWDGRNNSGAKVNLAPAYYPFSLSYSNNCESKTIEGKFFYQTEYIEKLNDPLFDYSPVAKQDLFCPGNTTNYYPCINVPEPCCSEQPDIVLANGYLTRTKVFRALNSIEVRENVQVVQGADIKLFAPTIITDKEFRTNNPNVKIIMDPFEQCPKQMLNNGFNNDIGDNNSTGGNKLNSRLNTAKIEVDLNNEKNNYGNSTNNDIHYSKNELSNGDENKLPAGQGINIYPNPNKGSFMVANSGKFGTIIITSILGNIIFEKQITETVTEINLGSSAKGLYALRFINGSFTEVKQIIVE